MEENNTKSVTTHIPPKPKNIVHIVIFALCILGFFIYRQKKLHDIRMIVIAEYNSFIESYDYSDTTSKTVDKIEYKINKIRRDKTLGSGEYTVDVTWYYTIPKSTFSSQAALNRKVLDEVSRLLLTHSYNCMGEIFYFNYTNKNYKDSVRVVVNDGESYSGAAQVRWNEMRRGEGIDYYGHDKNDAMKVAKKVVKSYLKSPSSAVFCSISDATFSCDGESWNISGWVDAQNSFGVLLRNSFAVTITFTSSGEYTIDSCSITEP